MFRPIALLALSPIFPLTALAHTGHPDDGIIGQFLNAEHVFANILTGAVLVLGLIAVAYKQYRRRRHNTEV